MKYILPMTALCSAVLLTACGDDDAAINEAVKGSISLTGTARVNETLSIENDYSDRNGIERNTPSYQWFANNSAITDAIGATYDLTSSELQQDVHVKIDFLDDDGFAETLTSKSVNVFYPYTISMVGDRNTSMGIVHSENYGSTWSSPNIPVISDSAEEHYNPSIASDGQGNLVAVSVSIKNSSYAASGSEEDIVISLSSDNGGTWSDIGLLIGSGSSDTKSDEDPVVATDSNGNWMVAWSSAEDILGTTGADKDIFYVTSSDNGANWGAVKALNPEAATDDTSVDIDISPKISMNGDEWTVIWSSTNDPDDTSKTDYEVYSLHSSDGGETWLDQTKVSQLETENTTDERFFEVHINDSGRGVLAWSAHENGTDLDVYAATTVNFGETWLGAKVVNSKADDDLATDHDYVSGVYALTDGIISTIVVAWYGSDESTGSTTGSDDEAFFSSTVTANTGVAWNAQKVLSSTPDSDGTNEFSTKILARPDGKWVASWVNSSGNVYISQSDDLSSWSDTPEELTGFSNANTAWLLH